LERQYKIFFKKHCFSFPFFGPKFLFAALRPAKNYSCFFRKSFLYVFTRGCHPTAFYHPGAFFFGGRQSDPFITRGFVKKRLPSPLPRSVCLRRIPKVTQRINKHGSSLSPLPSPRGCPSAGPVAGLHPRSNPLAVTPSVSPLPLCRPSPSVARIFYHRRGGPLTRGSRNS